MVAPKGTTQAARYVSVLAILALAAAGTFWLRSNLQKDIDLDEALEDASVTADPQPSAQIDIDNKLEDAAVPALPKLQWRTVDGGVRLVQSDDARQRWSSDRERIYEGLREQKETLLANTYDAGTAGPKPGTLSKEYIQRAIDDLKPLFAECYDLALSDDDKVEGKLTVAFTIAGDTQGGIVESAEIAEGASAKHDGLRECMRETIYTLELPAPKNGGVIHVRYPFHFKKAAPTRDAGT